MSDWLRNFFKWIFPWTDGQKKIAKSVGKIEGLISDLERGVQLVEIEQTKDQDLLQKRIDELEAFRIKTSLKIAAMTNDRDKAGNAVKGFRAILRGDIGTDTEEVDWELSDGEPEDEG